MTALPTAEEALQQARQLLTLSRQQQPSAFNEDLTVIDRETGAPAAQRAAVGFLSRDEDKLAYLEKQYGPGNVAQTRSGEIVVRGPQGGWVQFNEEGLSGGDIAALAGPAIEYGAGIAGSIAGAPLAGSAIGQAAGRSVRQGVSDYLLGNYQAIATNEPGGSSAPPMYRASEIGAAGAEGALGDLIPLGVQKGADLMRPGYLPAKKALEQIEPGGVMNPIAVQGTELAEKVPLSLGQQTQNPTLLNIEGVARRAGPAQDVIVGGDFTRGEAFTKSVNDYLNSISNADPKMSPGKLVQDIFVNGIRKLDNQRRMLGAKVYGEAFDSMGGRTSAAIDTSNLQQAARELYAQLDAPSKALGISDSSLAGRLERYIKDMPNTLSAEQMKREVSLLNDELAGTGDLLKDIKPSNRKRVAGVLKEALYRDLQASEQAGVIAPGSMDKLAAADAAYAQVMDTIQQANDLAIAKIAGKKSAAPEDIMNAMSNMQPSEAKSVMEFLRKQDPERAEQVTRALVEKSVQPALEKIIGNQLRYNPAKLASQDRPGDIMRIMAILPDASRKGLEDLFEIGRRMKNMPMAGSPTGPYLATAGELQQNMQGLLGNDALAGGVVGALSGGAEGPGIVGAVGGAATAKGLSIVRGLLEERNTRKLAAILTDPNGLDALRTLAKPGVGVKAITRATETLIQLLARGAGVDAGSAAGSYVSEMQQQ